MCGRGGHGLGGGDGSAGCHCKRPLLCHSKKFRNRNLSSDSGTEAPCSLEPLHFKAWLLKWQCSSASRRRGEEREESLRGRPRPGLQMATLFALRFRRLERSKTVTLVRRREVRVGSPGERTAGCADAARSRPQQPLQAVKTHVPFPPLLEHTHCLPRGTTQNFL